MFLYNIRKYSFTRIKCDLLYKIGILNYSFFLKKYEKAVRSSFKKGSDLLVQFPVHDLSFPLGVTFAEIPVEEGKASKRRNSTLCG